MKKRFTEEQIVKMILEHKEGKSVSENSWENGIAEQTFYKWQQKYGDMKVSEVKKKKLIFTKHPRSGSNSITMYLHKDGIRINHKPTDNCFIESFNRVFRDEC